jgi:hypothetical protein
MKALIILAILILIVVAGCAPAAPAPKEAKVTVTTDAVVAEATQDFVEETDTVEIGEMI